MMKKSDKLYFTANQDDLRSTVRAPGSSWVTESEWPCESVSLAVPRSVADGEPSFDVTICDITRPMDASRKFKVGDLVTRHGTDVHRVLAVDAEGDSMKVECVRAPDTSWCKIGDIEDNLTRRYDFLDAEVHKRQIARATAEDVIEIS